MKYFTTAFSILLSSPTMLAAAVATAILCGDTIFPAVDPSVLAAINQDWLTPSCSAVEDCNFANKTLLEVELPVTNVPIAPISGDIRG